MKQIKVLSVQAVYHLIDRPNWKLKWSIHQDPWIDNPKEDNLGKELVFCIEHDDWSKCMYQEKDVTIPLSEYKYLLIPNYAIWTNNKLPK